MTTLANILSDLSNGVLSNLHLGSSGDGSITEKHLPRVMVFINDGLTKLYSKFALRRKSLVVTIPAGTAQVNIASTEGDFLKVIGVEKLGAYGVYAQVPLNDSYAAVAPSVGGYPVVTSSVVDGVFTPAIDILEVPTSPTPVTYKVHYQARHSHLEVGDLGSKEIELPDVLYEALTMYVAYRAYMAINTQEAIATAAAYLSQYTTTCNEVISSDTAAQSMSNTNGRFQNNGWR